MYSMRWSTEELSVIFMNLSIQVTGDYICYFCNADPAECLFGIKVKCRTCGWESGAVKLCTYHFGRGGRK